MKKVTLTLITALFFAFLITTNAQVPDWSLGGNFVSPGQFLGSTNNEDLILRTTSIPRFQMLRNTSAVVNSQSVTLNGNLALGASVVPQMLPLSRVHIFGSTTAPTSTLGYREWMQYGLSYSVDAFDMYVGPAKMANSLIYPVVAWSRGIIPSGQPSAMRFIATDSNGSGSGSSSHEGLEVMRLTDEGRAGVGTSWTDARQPKRTLDVVQTSALPQLRLTRVTSNILAGGKFADFQVSSAGHLHISPRDSTRRRALAIGWLPGETGFSSPINAMGFRTFLDVGGLTRIRDLRDTLSNCLITGFYASVDSAGAPIKRDNFLTRLDFLTGDTADCYALGATGKWINICDLTTDLDWEHNTNDVWTGHGLNGYPDRNVGIGLNPSSAGGLAKLHVKGTGPNGTTFWQTAIRAETQAFSGGAFSAGVELKPSGGTVLNYGTRLDLTGMTAALYGHSVEVQSSNSLW